MKGKSLAQVGAALATSLLACTVLSRQGIFPPPATGSSDASSGQSPASEPSAGEIRLTIADSPLNRAAQHLGELSSFRAQLIRHVQGVRSSGLFEASFTAAYIRSSEPAVEMATISASGADGSLQRDGAAYVSTANGYFFRWSKDADCQTGSEDAKRVFLTPAGVFLPDMSGATESGKEMGSGIPADKFTLSGNDSGVVGEVWLASSGGYVLKAALSKDGPLPAYGGDASGHVTWEYTLSDVNAPVRPELPKGCQYLSEDLPVPNDAQGVRGNDFMVSYQSTQDATMLWPYIEGGMLQRGWKATAETSSTTSGGEFFNDGGTVTVLLFPGEGFTDVMFVFSSSANQTQTPLIPTMPAIPGIPTIPTLPAIPTFPSP